MIVVFSPFAPHVDAALEVRHVGVRVLDLADDHLAHTFENDFRMEEDALFAWFAVHQTLSTVRQVTRVRTSPSIGVPPRESSG